MITFDFLEVVSKRCDFLSSWVSFDSLMEEDVIFLQFSYV